MANKSSSRFGIRLVKNGFDPSPQGSKLYPWSWLHHWRNKSMQTTFSFLLLVSLQAEHGLRLSPRFCSCSIKLYSGLKPQSASSFFSFLICLKVFLFLTNWVSAMEGTGYFVLPLSEFVQAF